MTADPRSSLSDGSPVASRRRTPRNAFGISAVWVMAASLTLCVAMIVGLFGVILAGGAVAFWPRAIELVTLDSGEQVLGIHVREEWFDPGPDVRSEVSARIAAGELDAATLDERGRVLRRLYQIGNRELNGDTFKWLPVRDIFSTETPEWATHLDRVAWGIFIGKPIAVVRDRGEGEREVIAESDGLADALPGLLAEARDRRAEIEGIEGGALAHVNHRLSAVRVASRDIERRSRPGFERPGRLALLPWIAMGAGVLTTGVLAWRSSRGKAVTPATSRGLAVLAVFGAVAVAALQPIAGGPIDAAEAEARLAALEAERGVLEGQYNDLIGRIDRLRSDDAAVRLVIEDVPSGRIAPVSPSERDEPIALSSVTRITPANTLSVPAKLGVYAGRWKDFLSDEPRDANLAGGVFPVIFGTTILTMLLAVTVVPLGVIAAIYLREYAKQGFVVSLIRIAVNNLAGVPSIVYGVFGLGFFCYTVGGFVDSGAEVAVEPVQWWVILGGSLVLALGAVLVGAIATRGRDAGTWTRRGLGLLWGGAVVGLLVLVFRTPYFDGLFTTRAADGPVFGTRGMLWASLTLALLTLPVVIVATEEAIAAVPRSMREGSFGAGASKWQTIRRIVLPGAMPGIMTGAILAMARGAGEVAPLMLVGAVKLAPELPVSSEFPFLHPERSFMHLGFHIYDLWFQSPDSEAARGLVWATTLLLILIVLSLNMVAFIARARFRSRLVLRAL